MYKKLHQTCEASKQAYQDIAGYKVNIKKLIIFLLTNNEHIEFEIKNTITLTLAPTNEILI